MRLRLALFFLVAMIIVGAVLLQKNRDNASADNLLLLIPDNLDTQSNLVKVWQEVAENEGLHLKVMHDTDFLRPHLYPNNYPGIILPDTIHKQINPILVGSLITYVRNGGKLFLIYDAGTLDARNNFYMPTAPLSILAGVSYSLYRDLHEKTIQFSEVGGAITQLSNLDIPPGKSIAYNDSSFWALSTYQYGILRYPYFFNSGRYDGIPLLTTPNNQLIAGYRNVDKGSVLFVNLPLTYLYTRTDAMLLHAFLSYFATQLLHLPKLLAVPNGIGGLIMNIHVDSNAAIKPIAELDKLGIFNQGPYSVDFTAGPDVYEPGGGEGLDVAHNPVIQNWIHLFLKKGYAIGDHGGWIHNYFGLNINENNEAEFVNDLVLNDQAMTTVTGQKTLEYSAPVGNQPSWVTRWLVNHGFIAYYTTSNSGAPPARNFINNQFDNRSIYAFPNLPFGPYAAFEEFYFGNVPETQITQWLIDSTDFMATHHTSRLIYYHPPGAIHYPDAIHRWLAETQRLTQTKQFNWYTMVEMAKFLTQRRQVDWQFKKIHGTSVITATHPISLAGFAWKISKLSCQQPHISEGNGQIHSDDINSSWIIIADKVKQFTINCEEQHATQ